MHHLRIGIPGLILLTAIPAVLEAGSPKGGPSDSVEFRAGSGNLVWTWRQIDRTNSYALYGNGIKVAIYDHDTRTYHRVNQDGSLTKEPAPPWEVMKYLQRPREERARLEASPEPSPPKEEPEEPPEEPESFYDMYLKDAPPWFPYGVGGVIALLVCGIGLIINSRRR